MRIVPYPLVMVVNIYDSTSTKPASNEEKKALTKEREV
jgi:hypothetical protein